MPVLEWATDHPILTFVLLMMVGDFVLDVIKALRGG